MGRKMGFQVVRGRAGKFPWASVGRVLPTVTEAGVWSTWKFVFASGELGTGNVKQMSHDVI